MRKTAETDDSNIFFCEGKGLSAKGEYNEEGFVVFKDSKMYGKMTKSIHNYLISKRKALINDAVVKPNEGHYIFTVDHQFTSPSQAAAIVLGRSANGWKEWRNEDGKTLDQVKRKEV